MKCQECGASVEVVLWQDEFGDSEYLCELCLEIMTGEIR
jgi:hypothetical protein